MIKLLSRTDFEDGTTTLVLHDTDANVTVELAHLSYCEEEYDNEELEALFEEACELADAGEEGYTVLM